MMEIEVTEKRKVNIAPAQCKNIMLRTMKELADWKDGMWFNPENRKMMQTTEYVGSHSFDEDVEVRDATEMDMAVHLFILALNAQLNAEVKKNTIAFPLGTQA